jgi:hypothetical protein
MSKDTVNYSKNQSGENPLISEENVKGAITKVLGDLGDYLEGKKGDICKTGQEYKSKMKEHPVGCALTALALGVIIGAVLKK